MYDVIMQDKVLLTISLPIIGLITLLVIIGFISTQEECPREILQYNCKGKYCDHSPEALREAKSIIRL